jgi:L-rhamnose mutarotase
MALFAWTMTLRSGAEAEYERRHREIWPEMVAALRDAGIVQYAIFREGLAVFGCFEAANETAVRAALKASPVNARWQETMAPLVASQPDTGVSVAHRLARIWELPDRPAAAP